jgi:hypothetical protein
MARARNIKPGFFVNEELVNLSFSTRLLFIGLWTIADREGRLHDKPKQIKMAIFPGDDVNIEEALNELAQAKFIVRYEIRGEKYIAILNFSKHQNPHVKEAASIIPAPGKHRARTRRAGLIPDSLLLIPDSGVADSGSPPPLSRNPAVVIFEEVFGSAGVSFARQIAKNVSDLSIWGTLVRNKSSYADDPKKRQSVPKWILNAYDEAVAEKIKANGTANGKVSKPDWQIAIDNCKACDERGYIISKDFTKEGAKVCKHDQ